MQDSFRKSDLNGYDILLVVPPPFFTKMPHLGVAYLSSFLKNKGIKVFVYDMNLELHNNSSQDLKRYWQIDCLNSLFITEIAERLFNLFEREIIEFVDTVLEQDLRIIGFSVNQISIFLANRIAKLIKSKNPSKIIIFGGPGTFFKHPRDLIEPGFVDIFVIGEGEEPLFNIIHSLKEGRKIRISPGILVPRDDNYFEPQAPTPIMDLDSIPFPDFSEFELSEYNQGDDYKPLPLLLSRGCFKRCTYCIDHIMWPRYRLRSPQHVFREIEYHIKVNKVKAFEFNDLLCNGNLKQLSTICDLIIESGFKFNWVSYAIIRKDMDSELFSKLKKSGCHTLIYGLEHASDRILKAMNKNYTIKEAEEVIRLAHQAGICTNVNFIVGFPGETEDDFNRIIEFLYRNKDYIDEVTNVSGCTLFPESDLGRFKSRYGVIWKEGTDPMLFKDVNGLDREARNERVEKLLKILENSSFRKAIINRPQLNPVLRKDEE